MPYGNIDAVWLLGMAGRARRSSMADGKNCPGQDGRTVRVLGENGCVRSRPPKAAGTTAPGALAAYRREVVAARTALSPGTNVPMTRLSERRLNCSNGCQATVYRLAQGVLLQHIGRDQPVPAQDVGACTSSFHSRQTVLCKMNKFIVVVPVYNADEYISDCLASVMCQTYENFTCVIIDDRSTDQTASIVKAFQDDPVSPKLTRVYNTTRAGSPLANIVKGISMMSRDGEDIIVNLDGDDRFYHDGVLEKLNEVYSDPSIWLTYGNFVPRSGNYGPYCKKIENTRLYRKSRNWYASHLRTFKSKLWNKIRDDDLRDTGGRYFNVAGDAALLYPMLEMCGMKHHHFISEVLYEYNDLNALNEMKVAEQKQFSTGEFIQSKPCYEEIVSFP